MGKKRVVRGMKTKPKASENARNRRAQQFLDRILSGSLKELLDSSPQAEATPRVIAARMKLIQANPRLGNLAGWHILHEDETRSDNPLLVSEKGYLYFAPRFVEAASLAEIDQALIAAMETGITSGVHY